MKRNYSVKEFFYDCSFKDYKTSSSNTFLKYFNRINWKYFAWFVMFITQSLYFYNYNNNNFEWLLIYFLFAMGVTMGVTIAQLLRR